eukprot:361921-Chlamydomonas_euryale.AAC.11
MIGYGAWASTAMTMVAKNALPESGHSLFEETVQMWVGDEDAEGGKLADVINQTHQNPKDAIPKSPSMYTYVATI